MFPQYLFGTGFMGSGHVMILNNKETPCIPMAYGLSPFRRTFGKTGDLCSGKPCKVIRRQFQGTVGPTAAAVQGGENGKNVMIHEEDGGLHRQERRNATRINTNGLAHLRR
jgi:hypothetical protein